MSRHQPLIALISATPAAIEPATSGIAREFPAATTWNILDDRLLTDANEQGGISRALADRMRRLIHHAVTEGADAILLTCSLYGAVAHDVDVPVPVLPPDDAAFAVIIGQDYERVLVVASLDSALEDSIERLRAYADARGNRSTISGIAVPDAFVATQANDDSALTAALVAACNRVDSPYDAILLAQYSLAPAAAAMTSALGVPVVTGPDTAARSLKASLTAIGQPS